MLRSFKTEIDPTPEQIIKINKTIGVCRFIYNFFIAYNKDRYSSGESFVRGNAFSVWLNNEFVPNNPDYIWIKEVSSVAVKRSIDDADAAFQHFFKKRRGYPKLKKKNRSDVKMYFYKKSKNDCVSERHRIKIPSLGWIRLKEKGYIPTSDSGVFIKSGRISKRAGRYYVSVVMELPDEERSTQYSDGIGVHLGVRQLAVVSNGETYENINKSDRIRKLEKRLSREQRKLSRKFEHKKHGGETQGRNIEKQKLKVQRAYKKLSDVREDYMNQVIAEMVKTKPSYIVIADLNLMQIMKNKFIAKSVRDQRLRDFREKLTAKCHELGIEMRIAEHLYPSAKICSSCGASVRTIAPSAKLFRCSCGYSADRAYNSSVNLKNAVTYTVA